MKASPVKKSTIYYLLAAVTAGFLLLTLFISLDPLSWIDRKSSEEIQEHHNALLDSLMKLISWFGYMPNSVIMVVGIAALFFFLSIKEKPYSCC